MDQPAMSSFDYLMTILTENLASPAIRDALDTFMRFENDMARRQLEDALDSARKSKALRDQILTFPITDQTEIARLHQGDILLGMTPDGYEVHLDILGSEFAVVLTGIPGTGKSTLLYSILIQLDQIEYEQNRSHSFLA